MKTANLPEIDPSEAVRLTRADLPRALAILRDHTRRGGVRVVRVVVLAYWPPIAAAATGEIGTGRHHVLPFTRLTTKRGPELRTKVRAQIERQLFPPAAQGSPAALQAVAQGAGTFSE